MLAPLSPLLAAVVLLLAAPVAGQAQGAGAGGDSASHNRLVHDILRELVGINTAPSGGNPARATRAMARRLLAAGYPSRDVKLAGAEPAYLNLVATLRGRDPAARPILLLAHVDVVEARRDDWSFDPYTLTERDGYLYGRGTSDNKGGAAVIVANLIRWKRERFVPERDVIAILTTDEETTAERGMIWLLANEPRLANAEYALNTDAGGFLEREGKPPAFFVQLAEKMYQTYRLEVRNRGGHSSLPRADNAIYTLARGLGRLEAYRFPVVLSDLTRVSFASAATLEHGTLAAALAAVAAGDTTGDAIDRLSSEPDYNGNLRTTCVATMLDAGHAENALPQRAVATVNCRIVPGTTTQQVQQALVDVLGDTAIRVTAEGSGVASPASPLRDDVLRGVRTVAQELWPGATTVPVMENGATDGLYLRNRNVPVYGMAGPLFLAGDDRAHGRDERIGVHHLGAVREYWYRLVKRLTSQTTPPLSPTHTQGNRR